MADSIEEQRHLDEWATRYLPEPSELQDRLKALVFGHTSQVDIREIILDAGVTIDTHAPLGGFFHRGYGGERIRIEHRHSLLEHRTQRLIEEGSLEKATFAASMNDFDGNTLLRSIVEKSVESSNFSLAQLAIDAMSRYEEGYEDPELNSAQATLQAAMVGQQELSA